MRGLTAGAGFGSVCPPAFASAAAGAAAADASGSAFAFLLTGLFAISFAVTVFIAPTYVRASSLVP
ncbi:hypothetical protein D3C72_1862500 [compost metagenome]